MQPWTGNCSKTAWRGPAGNTFRINVSTKFVYSMAVVGIVVGDMDIEGGKLLYFRLEKRDDWRPLRTTAWTHSIGNRFPISDHCNR